MKILISISIPVITFFVAGAWNLQHSPEMAVSSQTDIPTVECSAPVLPKGPKMWADNSTLYKGEVLELQFAAPNAPYLGVVDPQGHFFYVVFPKESAVGKLKPLVDSKRFTSFQSLKIRTGSFKADPYIYGVYTNQPVFTQTGTYTFILGENLHVDDPYFIDKVTVQYIHKRRPASAPADVAMN